MDPIVDNPASKGLGAEFPSEGAGPSKACNLEIIIQHTKLRKRQEYTPEPLFNHIIRTASEWLTWAVDMQSL
ncbi:hypothetical protein J6590_036644 [Homalodisca vitripennis]|nr:hypothetical protein J6590_036644 [Homalodisca vitripennis]